MIPLIFLAASLAQSLPLGGIPVGSGNVMTLCGHVLGQASPPSGHVSPAITITGGCTPNLGIFIVTRQGCTATVSDSTSHTWNGGHTGGGIEAYYATGSFTNGQTFSETCDFASYEIQLWSNAAVSPNDANGVLAGYTSATTCQTAAINPGAGQHLVVAANVQNVGTGVTYSIDSGLTISDSVVVVSASNYGSAAAYKVQSAGASIQPTWTLSGTQTGECLLLSFAGI